MNYQKIKNLSDEEVINLTKNALDECEYDYTALDLKLLAQDIKLCSVIASTKDPVALKNFVNTLGNYKIDDRFTDSLLSLVDKYESTDDDKKEWRR